MAEMSILTRWVGAPISKPNAEDCGPSPIGRQKHYGGVELTAAGEQVNVNDVVEVHENDSKIEMEQQRGEPRHPHRRLAQVLSMWEDTFTGVYKCHVRWLVHSSSLPEDAFARLQAARRAFAEENDSGSGGCGDKNKDQCKKAPAAQGDSLLPRHTKGNRGEDGGDGNVVDDDDEVFLTAKTGDLDVRSIVRPVMLSVAATTATELPACLRGKTGPRLSHAFDAPSGDFIPLEETDAIIKRARVRQAGAVASANRLAEEAAAAKMGKPVARSNGWLMPRRSTAAESGAAASSGGRFPAAASVRDSESEGEHIESDTVEREEAASKSDDMEWEVEKDDERDSSDSADTEFQWQSVPPPRKSARIRKPPVCGSSRSNDDVGQSRSPSPASSSSPRVVHPPATPPADSPSSRPTFKHDEGRVEPIWKRPRRLAMPPVQGEPELSPRYAGEPVASTSSSSPSSAAVDTDGRLARTRRASAEARGRYTRALSPLSGTSSSQGLGAEDPAPSRHRLSIAGKRKRGRPTKAEAAAAAAAALEGRTEEVEVEYAPRCTLVGDDYQADIPDILPMKAQKDGHLPPSGTGAKMVWRSIRDWDPYSRGMLSAYLDAAEEVVRAKQVRPGVAAHVRLGGGGSGKPNLTDSYAVWAVTAGHVSGGVIRVGCSEMIQTEVPVTAISRVQSTEEALAALVKARCTLDDPDRALKILATDDASPESIETWTVQQVRTLEQALEKEYNADRRLHGWAGEGQDLGKDDFIDLAAVSKQVEGKSPSQVLSFYYRYLGAATGPLMDVVYGEEAAEARRNEPIVPAAGENTSEFMPATERAWVPAQCAGSPVDRNDNAAAAIRDPPARCTSRADPAGLESRAVSKGKSAAAITEGGAPPARHKLYTSTSGQGEATSDGTPPHDRGLVHPVTVGAAASPPAAAASPPAAAAPTPRASSASGYGGGGDGSTRRRAARDQGGARKQPPADVEVLEVDDSDDLAEGVEPAWRSPYAGAAPGPTAGRPKYSIAQAHGEHSDGQSRVLSWRSRQARPPPQPAMAMAPAPDARRYLPAAPAMPAAAIPGATTTAAPYSYRGAAPASRPAGGRLQQRQHEQEQPHPAARFGREPDNGGMGDASRARDAPPRVGNGGGGGGGGGRFPGYEGRGTRSDDAMDEDTFGFMAPCWRLLERSKAFIDEDQLRYMRGLILKHVQKPMTRDQLLERAESCLQEQVNLFAAFVKIFDRIDGAFADDELVPLYPATKRVPEILPESMSMAYCGRVPVHTYPSERRPSYPYPQASPLQHAYAVPPGSGTAATVGSGGRGGGGRRAGPMRVPASENYSRVAPAAAPLDERSGHHRSLMPPHAEGGGWDRSMAAPATAGGGGEVVRSHRPLPLGSYLPATTAMRYPDDRYHEVGRGRGEVMGSWPQQYYQHFPQQQQRQQPRRWQPGGDGAAPLQSVAAAVPAEAQPSRRRVPDWGDGRAGGWS